MSVTKVCGALTLPQVVCAGIKRDQATCGRVCVVATLNRYDAPMLIIGLMSGTSLDGMDAALVRLEGPTHATLISFITRPYTDEERAQIQGALNGATAAELARLHVGGL